MGALITTNGLTSWWINLFKDAQDQQVFNSCNEMEMECLWFCFSDILQKDLDSLKGHWNTHYIRRSRHETVAGRPNELYFLPALHGKHNCLCDVTGNQVEEVLENLDLTMVQSDYQDYFKYIRETTGLPLPANWRQAFDLYHRLLGYATWGDEEPND